MSQELTVSAALHMSKDGIIVDSAGQGFNCLRFTVTGVDAQGFTTQVIGTSAEAIAFTADIATPGYMIAKNTTASGGSHTKLVIRSGSSGAGVVELRPGEIALFRLGTTTPYAISTGAVGTLYYAICED